MSELILHHYDVSPYAEKIRLAMGLKGLAWRSVHIPMVMPKPDLTALTGGYRLTPVLQVGADVYCDTRLIAAVLEERVAEPSFFPEGRTALTRGLAFWGESAFMEVITLFMGQGVFPQDFVADRQTMIPGGFHVEQATPLIPSKRDQIRARLDLLEGQLAAGAPFLMGDQPSLADLSAYHPLWGLRSFPTLAGLIEPFPAVGAWMDRVASIGHGEPSEMPSGEAVEIARAASPATVVAEDAGDPNGRKPGDRVRVLPETYGLCPVEGELVASDAQRIAIRRHDERAGEVVVHFPREGYLTLPVD